MKVTTCFTFITLSFQYTACFAWTTPHWLVAVGCPSREFTVNGQILDIKGKIDSKLETDRRAFVTETAVAIGAASLLTSLPSNAAAPTSTSEAIRRGAANIPGYGQTDVFYPKMLAGKWKATRSIVSSNDPLIGAKTPLTVEYEMRFIQSVEDDAVVADRGFNQGSFLTALNNILYEKGTANPIQSIQWSESNPNDLRWVNAEGGREEIKVTKRATEKTEETVSSSEFRRITKEDSRGIPSISAQRVLNKWKVVTDMQVEGIEVVYDAGGGLADPMAMRVGSAPSPSSSATTPVVLMKSRLRLDRID
mmetsp:Transcript_21580/g.30472  ORF Transcript_21580/g.30472 Transcript_21580/m.30472 type:complete len:307 (+) Transcript_21580:89-1009(+)